MKDQLETRFQTSRTITGTRQLHSFVLVSCDTLQVRAFSTSTTFKTEKVTKQDIELGIEEISGYVTCIYNAEWLAFALETEQEIAEVKVTFLHPRGPARSFKYPSTPDVLFVPSSDILTKVDPKTATGRTYTLGRKQSKIATEKLTDTDK